MSDLPPDLLRDILLRLPAESFPRLRRVCKNWLRIIDDSSFVTHAQQNSHTILLKNRSESSLYSFSLDSLHFTNGTQLIDVIHIKSLPRELTLPIRSFCNSLILMDNRRVKKELIICNPLTRERLYVKLPQQIYVTPPSWRYALGYDYSTDDYKVVVIDKPGRDDVDWQTHVYGLKSDSWRRIQNCPRGIHYPRVTFLDGVLYWPGQDTITVLALDLGSEKISEFPLPLALYRSWTNTFTNFYLYALDGCLVCSFDDTGMETLYGWVMKDKSWIKLFSVRYSIHGNLTLVAYLKRKQQVVLEYRWGFLWIDSGTNSVKNFFFHGFQGIDFSRIFPGSLVRLNVRDSGIGVGYDAAGRISKRKTKRRVARLMFSVSNVGADDYSS